MPSLTYQFVYYGSGGSHTRQPRVINSYGGFTPIPGLTQPGVATLAAGTPFSALPVEPTQTDGGVTYTFGFMSVSGLTGGGLISFDPGMPPSAGQVGASPVVVLVVYLPPGGGGGKSSGAIIDAFDETLGTLVDDTFVTVATNGSPDGSRTTSGNVDGYVDTTSTDEVITALSHINPTNANFDRWQVLGTATPTAGGLNLYVSAGQTEYAFAFYRNPAKKIFKEHKDFKDFKEHKEFIKEIEKVRLKDNLPEIPNKYFGKEKDGKELVENPGDIFQDIVDPYLVSEVQRLNERIAKIETLLDTAIRGKAFIKAEDRPAVGQNIAKQKGKGE